MARKRSNFSDAQIEEFEFLINKFCLKWIEMHGREGITNYIHMVGAQHVAHYLKIHHNLYKFLQQGWEVMNAKIKTLYFQYTQHGGKGHDLQSHIVSVVHFIPNVS